MKIEKLKAALSALTLPELKTAYVCSAGFRLAQALILDEIEIKDPALYARHFNAEEFDLDVAGLLSEI